MLIQVKAGNLASVAKRAAAALGCMTYASPFRGVYVFGDQLVRVSGAGTRLHQDPNGAGGTLTIIRADQDVIEHACEETSRFVRYASDERGWVSQDVPAKVARRLLARGVKWPKIPRLNGIVGAPILRPDGTVLDQPGYDPETGCFSTRTATTSPPCQSRRRRHRPRLL